TASGGPPRCVVAVAASTGGPPAVQQLLSAIPRGLPVAIVIAQHMPVRFTRAFAERLDRIVSIHVLEAEDGMPLVSGCAYVAPGSAHLELALLGDTVCARITQAPPGNATITPSADRLFRSCGTVYGQRMCGVILTGMGSDGRDGAAAAHAAGARILVEDPRSAVMSGMPQSAIDAGIADEVGGVEVLAASVVRFVASWASVPA
ncbi:MAG: chemotaxis protein CheB, partial [Deltaproteobacteria bacterium]|nr:chemotaxis protein CheB [Nannocystaceae bacterium]